MHIVDLCDRVSVDVDPVSGHYVLRAYVQDYVSDVWLESVSYYGYDHEDLDQMKRDFVARVLANNWSFVSDDFWD